MTVGTWTYCPTCGDRQHVRVESKTFDIMSEAERSAAVLRIAASHDPKCERKHTKGRA